MGDDDSVGPAEGNREGVGVEDVAVAVAAAVEGIAAVDGGPGVGVGVCVGVELGAGVGLHANSATLYDRARTASERLGRGLASGRERGCRPKRKH